MSIKQIPSEVSIDILSLSTVNLLSEAVKCLLINSLEAKSTHINIYIDWRSLSIQVIDNGTGISPEDMENVAKKGYSSKPFLKLTADVSRHTGSTLYALGKVSLLSIISNGFIKRNSSLARLLNPDDFTHPKFPYLKSSSFYCDPNLPKSNILASTCVTCTGLFHRFPVRRNLEERLKKSTFLGTLQEIVFKMAGDSDVDINIWLDGKQIVSLPRNTNLAKRYCQAFGKDLSFVAKTSAVDNTELQIFVSIPYKSSSKLPAKRFTFLNGNLQPKSSFPSPLSLSDRILLVLVKNLQISETLEFDFNSLTVESQNPKKNTCDSISQMISKLLLKIESEIHQPKLPKRSPGQGFETLPTKKGRVPKLPTRTPKLLPEPSTINYTPTQISDLSITDLLNCRVIAQLDHKFILLATYYKPVKLIAIDQHACDERIRVEKLISEFTDDASEGRLAIKLSSPFEFSVSLSELALLETVSLHFLTWGILYEVANDNVKISSLPEILLEKPHIIKEALLSYANDLSTLRKRPVTQASLRSYSNASSSSSPPQWSCILPYIPLVIIDCLNTKACRSLLKFGTPLNHSEMTHLVSSLNNCSFPLQCAHGRPSAVPLMTSVQDKLDANTSQFEMF